MNGGSTEDERAWARAADVREATLPKLGPYPIAGLLRRARRIAGLSQREFARQAGVSPSTVGRIESGAIVPVLPAFARMLAIAGLRLVVVDDAGHVVPPMRDIDDIRNGGGRLYPSHLDTILDPRPGEWWGDQYGLARPPETFHRDPRRREAQRARSVHSVREIWSYGLGDMSAMPPDLREDADPSDDAPTRAPTVPPCQRAQGTTAAPPQPPTTEPRGPAYTPPADYRSRPDTDPTQSPGDRVWPSPGDCRATPATEAPRGPDGVPGQRGKAAAYPGPFPIGFRRRRKRP
jgi:transcriptional regulator with XRE-family HTH domain